MIHTAQFYCSLQDTELKDICSQFQEAPSSLPGKINPYFTGIVCAFKQRAWGWMMYITVDFIKILGKAVITKDDYDEIEEKLNEYLQFIYGNETKKLIMLRLDYRFDVVVPEEANRKALLKLYKKTFPKHGFKKKYDQYKGSIYFNSKSIQVICYDKPLERQDKQQQIEAYEENVLRFEVRLSNDHLNYIKRKNKTDKSLFNYLCEDAWNDYMIRHLYPFFFAGNFYKINIAMNIINCSTLTGTQKAQVQEFLCDVSKYGLEVVKNMKKEEGFSGGDLKYSKYMINKLCNVLKQLNINPILIPKNMKVELGKEKCLYNPLPAMLTRS